MKKLVFGLIATVMFGFVGSAQENIGNDSNFKSMIGLNIKVLDAFIKQKIDVKSFDFNDKDAFLKVLNMSETEYMSIVKLNKDYAQKLIANYDLKGVCNSCLLNSDEQISEIKSTLLYFQNNPEVYSDFLNQMNTGTYTGKRVACSGWYYAEVALCAATIEAFPVYLLCCAVAYHAECH